MPTFMSLLFSRTFAALTCPFLHANIKGVLCMVMMRTEYASRYELYIPVKCSVHIHHRWKHLCSKDILQHQCVHMQLHMTKEYQVPYCYEKILHIIKSSTEQLITNLASQSTLVCSIKNFAIFKWPFRHAMCSGVLQS